MHRTTLPTFFLCCLLAACSDKTESPAENVFQPQVDSLKKAQSVEDTLLQSDKKRREALEQQER